MWSCSTHGHPDHMGGHPAEGQGTVQGGRAARGRHLGRVGRPAVARLLGHLPGVLRAGGARDEIVAMCGGDLPVDRILRDGETFESVSASSSSCSRGGTPVATARSSNGRPAFSSAAMTSRSTASPPRAARACTPRSTTMSTTTSTASSGFGRCRSRSCAPRTTSPSGVTKGSVHRAEHRLHDEMDALVRMLGTAEQPLTTADVATAVGTFCGTSPPVSRSRPSTPRPPT